MSETLTFDQLRDVLEHAGYVSSRIKGSHYLFVNADRQRPEIALPIRSRYGDRHVVPVRRILDLADAMSPAEFDRLAKSGNGHRKGRAEAA